jgi:hypothetical protein
MQGIRETSPGHPTAAPQWPDVHGSRAAGVLAQAS